MRFSMRSTAMKPPSRDVGGHSGADEGFPSPQCPRLGAPPARRCAGWLSHHISVGAAWNILCCSAGWKWVTHWGGCTELQCGRRWALMQSAWGGGGGDELLSMLSSEEKSRTLLGAWGCLPSKCCLGLLLSALALLHRAVGAPSMEEHMAMGGGPWAADLGESSQPRWAVRSLPIQAIL